MKDYSDVTENYSVDELRSMIDADAQVDGATHPLLVTAALAMSTAFCPTTYCTKSC